MLRATLRSLMAHKLRLLLTGLSVVIGVAFVAGTFVFTDTLKATFDDLVGRTSKNLSVVVRSHSDFSQTDIGAGTGRGPIPESLLPTVRSVPGVRQATPEVQGSVVLVTSAGKAVLPKTPGPPTLGVSWVDSVMSNVEYVSGRGPTGSADVALDKSAANRFGIKVGDTVRVQGSHGITTATICGIATLGGSDNMAGAVVAIFDPATAQKIYGNPGQLTEINVAAQPGVSQTALAQRIQQVLPTTAEAVTAKTVNKEQSDAINKGLSFINVFLLIFAFIAVFVSSFIILNTFTMLVAQRTRELALLRALGASRRQITTSVLGEALAVGLVASTVGFGLGVLVAIGLRALLAGVGIDMPTIGLVISPRAAIWAYLVGTLVTLFAAVLPARRAAKAPPMAALRDDVALPARSLRVRAMIGSAVCLIGAIAMASSISGNSGSAAALTGVGVMLVFVGVATLSPFVSRPVVRVLGAPLRRVYGTVATLARSNAMRNPRRTASTASALMIGLTLVTTLGVIASSAKASVASIIDRNLGADYILTTSSFTGFSPDVAAQAAKVNGVADVVEARAGEARIDGNRSAISALSTNADKAMTFDMQAGSFSALSRGEVLMPEKLADSKHYKIGQAIKVEFPTGKTQQLKIGGWFKDNGIISGYLISLPVYAANYNEQLDATVLVLAQPSQRDAVYSGLKAALASYPQVKVSSQADYKDQIAGQVNQMLALMYGLLALGLLIAVLGIVNTLALSVYERTREIGLLRAVGMTRRQLRRMVRLESVIISMFGALLGLGLGSVFGWALVSSSGGDLTELRFPLVSLLIFLVAAAVVGVVAALWPARRAARLDVLKAIATE